MCFSSSGSYQTKSSSITECFQTITFVVIIIFSEHCPRSWHYMFSEKYGVCRACAWKLAFFRVIKQSPLLNVLEIWGVLVRRRRTVPYADLVVLWSRTAAPGLAVGCPLQRMVSVALHVCRTHLLWDPVKHSPFVECDWNFPQPAYRLHIVGTPFPRDTMNYICYYTNGRHKCEATDYTSAKHQIYYTSAKQWI